MFLATQGFPYLFQNMSHSEQNLRMAFCTIISGSYMKKQIRKRWRIETTNPTDTLWALRIDNPGTAWKALWGFDDDQYVAYEGLVAELNQINAPVVMRIVRTGD